MEKKLAMRYLTLKRHDRNDNNFLFEKADKQGYIVQHRKYSQYLIITTNGL